MCGGNATITNSPAFFLDDIPNLVGIWQMEACLEKYNTAVVKEARGENNFGVAGNGYIEESDYVKLLDNHGFKVIILLHFC